MLYSGFLLPGYIVEEMIRVIMPKHALEEVKTIQLLSHDKIIFRNGHPRLENAKDIRKIREAASAQDPRISVI